MYGGGWERGSLFPTGSGQLGNHGERIGEWSLAARTCAPNHPPLREKWENGKEGDSPIGPGSVNY